MTYMTRSDLITAMALRFPQLNSEDVETSVKTILDGMAQYLSRQSRIEIRGFGAFFLHYRPPRIGRNPKTGEKIEIPAKHVPHFKTSKKLMQRVAPPARPIVNNGRNPA
jgi:integration host factor subunit beta